MAASDRGDYYAATFPKTRAEGSTPTIDASTARQSISHRRPSATHAGSSVTDRPSAQR